MHIESQQRLRLIIRGAVQGVGFRPYIYRLATDLVLQGWVCNTASGVQIEVEGGSSVLRDFLLKVGTNSPDRAIIHSLEPVFLDTVGYQGFEIRNSEQGSGDAWVLPDIATCQDCRIELLDPTDRRYRYPFTNCTHCGPRYSIIQQVPYDRASTTMKKFVMCPECSAEYHDPQNRRFHAQPNACSVCGPQLQLLDAKGAWLCERDAALRRAGDIVRAGHILALKGLGGFQLIVDAASDAAVSLLRTRKRRLGKPLAVMFPDLARIKDFCAVNQMEERLLTSPESPVVLLRRRHGTGLSVHVAPGNPYLGVMLPYSPLHMLLLLDLGCPVVATSGNLAEETICFDETEALLRLKDIADFYLIHDRPIARAVDDSVARVILDKEQLLRRARGYAPLPVLVARDLPPSLAVGGQLKDCVALARGKNVFISQHIGDLETAQSFGTFQRVIADLKALYRIEPERVICDLHPDYHSTRAAHAFNLPVTSVQHHEAHVFACIGENEITLPVLGVAWDGSGYGSDGTVWGGEFIVVDGRSRRRFAHFEHIYLPGGEAAVREPRRSLLGALYAGIGDAVFEKSYLECLSLFTIEEMALIRQGLKRKLNCPLTSSLGRRFDAVAALVGLVGETGSFEGQAAMALEFALPEVPLTESYSFRVSGGGKLEPYVIHAPVWDELLKDIRSNTPVSIIASKFHNMLVDVIVWMAKESGLERVALTGGCFQNRYLTEQAVAKLRAAGMRVYWHQRVPPNDGGIALGQLLAAL